MKTSSAAQGGICAVIVTYHPAASFLHNLKQLKLQTAEIVVVDNSTDDSWIDFAQDFAKWPCTKVIRNDQNLGIAVALNIGIKYALQQGYDWIATFDQDSTTMPGFFEAMLAAYESCPFKKEVPLIAPAICYSTQESEKRRVEKPISLIRTAMTSGSLIRTHIFNAEGFYDESFFIDYVDHEFCLRLRKHGWKLIRANRARLLHRLGSSECHSFLGRPILIKSHAPWRRYYIMRNRMIVFRRYALSSPGWCLYDFFWIFLEVTKILLFESDKAPKMRNIIKGLADGLLGRMKNIVGPVS